MLYLLLCILSSTGIFIVFKALDRRDIPVFPVILINYLLATLLGFFLHGSIPAPATLLQQDWLVLSILIGVLFILMFFLVGMSTRRAGISVTTVASKMSVVFPIVFSMLIDSSDSLNLLKATAILAALTGVGLTVYRKASPDSGKRISAIVLPLVLFVGMGVVDSLVKLAQHRHVGDSDASLFSAILFLNALLSGLLFLILRSRDLPNFTRLRVWAWGLLLGTVNFGSIFFMVRALNYQGSSGPGLDSSLIFGVNNTGIVVLSVMAGLLLFREKPSPLNWMGIGISLLSFLLFSLG